MKRAVFLDRDGVINKAIIVEGLPKPAKTLREVKILPGVIEALTILKNGEFALIVVTNQPDVARGELNREKVQAIHAQMGETLGINHFYTCFHDDSDKCACRKPMPGLLIKAASDLKIDLSRSFMIGDRWRDIGAGQAAGCQSIFIDNAYLEKRPQMPYIKVSSLLQATQIIMEAKS